jgi:hypothetical protein
VQSVRSKAVPDLKRTTPANALPLSLVFAEGLPALDAGGYPAQSDDHADLLERCAFPDWDYMPGGDGDPFEPKATDWGRIDGRLVALDYSTPVYDSAGERAEQLRAILADWDK